MKLVPAFVRQHGAKSTALALALGLSTVAKADAFDDMFAAVDFTTVATAVGALGIAVIGIALAFKGIDLVKRGIKKA